MDLLFQNQRLKLLQTKKTVEWLVNNTTVSVFDPIDFKGYQRKIDDKHCSRIVEYLKREFFLPTAIICATDDDFSEDSQLRIVDGQHRVHAFEVLEKEVPERYEEIKRYEIPVIVMADVDENTEIDTFITINKTSKKVDTSLALVLKNKMNRDNDSENLTMSKAEYIAVELAQTLNFANSSNNIWYNKILFEGNPKNTAQTISLNAFVKSTRTLLKHYEKANLITLSWNNDLEIRNTIEKCNKILTAVWNIIKRKWPDLFEQDLGKCKIIQGAIGYSAFNRVMVWMLDNRKYEDEYEFISDFERGIQRLSVRTMKWLPGESFSKYSSESGYTIVARELYDEMKE